MYCLGVWTTTYVGLIVSNCGRVKKKKLINRCMGFFGVNYFRNNASVFLDFA